MLLGLLILYHVSDASQEAQTRRNNK